MLSFNATEAVAQVKPMIRFGYTHYYIMDSLSSLDSKIQGKRYVDLDLKDTSIKLLLGGQQWIFKQKPKKGVNHKSIVPYYSRRKLYSSRNDSINARIDYLKLLEFRNDTFKLEATLKKRPRNSSADKSKEIIFIPAKKLDGLYVGTSQKFRIAMLGVVITGVMSAIILTEMY